MPAPSDRHGPPGRRAQVLHADLLLALGLADEASEAERRLAWLAGFEPRPERAADPAAGATVAHAGDNAGQRPGTAAAKRAPDGPSSAQASAQHQPLRAGLVAVVRAQQADDAAATEADAQVAPLTDADCAPQSSAPPPQPPLLMPRTRLWPALRRSASHLRPAGLDLPLLLRQLSAGRLLRRLPQRLRSHWAGTLWVLQDESDRLAPYQRDFDALVDELLRLRGDDGLSLWRFRDLPHRPTQRETHSQVQYWHRALPCPAPGSLLLVLSDLGALAPHAALESAWAPVLKAWRRAGAQVQGWLPATPRQVPQPLARLASLHCLGAAGDGRAALRPQRGAWAGQAQRQAEHARLAALLVALQVRASPAVHLDVALLRSLRLQAPGLADEPALEALHWQSAQVRGSRSSRPLQGQAAPAARAGLSALAMAAQGQVLHTLCQHHASHGQSVMATEVLLWFAHASGQARALPQAVAALAEARSWFARWQADVLQGPGAAGAGRSFAADLLGTQAADATWWQQQGESLAPVWAASGSPGLPPGLDLQHAADARQRLARARGGQPLLAQVLACRGWLWLWPAGRAAPKGASLVLDPPALTGVLVQAIAADGQAQTGRWVPSIGQPLALAPLPTNGDQVMLLLPGAWVWLQAVQRPPGVVAMGRDTDGLFAELPPLGELPSVRVHAPDARPGGGWPLPGTGRTPQRDGFLQVSRTVQIGFDFAHGAWADLTVQNVVQRLRWLPSGEFWMGSPDDEPERFDDEGPRHRVRLTRGLWLADTACTQALWQAVMGSNPAHFSGDPQRPVEQVSFDDVQQFLARLQPLLPPGCQAVLPTEAEWEYACRAGTDTAFHFGPTISRAQVNFDAANDTPLAPRGDQSQATVPVKSLPPNPWGLCEMHGNVWEWCDDQGREYPNPAEGEVAEDLVGTREQGPEAHRAVRGGSWFGPALDARSANRVASPRRRADGSLGFRLALRCTSPQAPEGLGAPEAQDRSAAPGALPEVRALQAPRGRKRPATRPQPPARPPAQAAGGGALDWLRSKLTGAGPDDKLPPSPPRRKGRQ